MAGADMQFTASMDSSGVESSLSRIASKAKQTAAETSTAIRGQIDGYNSLFRAVGSVVSIFGRLSGIGAAVFAGGTIVLNLIDRVLETSKKLEEAGAEYLRLKTEADKSAASAAAIAAEKTTGILVSEQERIAVLKELISLTERRLSVEREVGRSVFGPSARASLDYFKEELAGIESVIKARKEEADAIQEKERLLKITRAMDKADEEAAERRFKRAMRMVHDLAESNRQAAEEKRRAAEDEARRAADERRRMFEGIRRQWAEDMFEYMEEMLGRRPLSGVDTEPTPRGAFTSMLGQSSFSPRLVGQSIGGQSEATKAIVQTSFNVKALLNSINNIRDTIRNPDTIYLEVK